MSISNKDLQKIGDQIAVVARYTFKPEYACDFSEAGNQIVEIAFEEIAEAREFALEFQRSLIDVTVLVAGKVIALADYKEEA